MTPPALRLLAPAKVNLHLRVGPPAPDGFHPLLTWMCTVALFDTLTLAGSDRPAGIALACDDPTLACDERNLIVRAGNAFAAALAPAEGGGAAAGVSVVSDGARAAVRESPAGPAREAAAEAAARSAGASVGIPGPITPGVSVTLQKRIPMGAGLGGGSSDGALMLVGLNRLWRAGWGTDALAALAARLGSDLPFFFHAPSAICTGRGEIVRPTPPPAVARWALLMLPAIAIPTPPVYRRFDEMSLGDPAPLCDEPDWAAWASLGAAELLPRLVNDLEPAAFAIVPELGRLRAELEQALGRVVRMSGSGSSLFTLFDAEPDADAAVERLSPVFAKRNVRAVPAELSPAFADSLNAI